MCPAAQAANFGLLDLQLTEADRRPVQAAAAAPGLTRCCHSAISFGALAARQRPRYVAI